MKTFYIALILIVSFVGASAQQQASPAKLTDEQWDLLFADLQGENWKEAFDLSSEYIETLKNDDKADAIENLRYILLYSAAGSVSIDKMSYDDLEKQLPKVVGKKVALPFHPIGSDCHPPMFNYVCKSSGEDYDVMITTSNSTATTILAFEYIKLAKKFDFAKHDGELGAVVGTVYKIVPNPNKSRILIMRIFTKDAEIKLQSDLKNPETDPADKNSASN